jgi:hypothetical protein
VDAYQGGHLAGLEEAVDAVEDGQILLRLAVLHRVSQVLDMVACKCLHIGLPLECGRLRSYLDGDENP